MKFWRILLLPLSLGACVTPPTMEELEAQAWQTGDWSAVERREDALARRAARQGRSAGLMCPEGTLEFCEVRAGDRHCQCVSRVVVERAFGWD